MISLMIETTVEEYIWKEWARDNDVDPDNPEEYDLANFVEDELGIFPDSVRML